MDEAKLKAFQDAQRARAGINQLDPNVPAIANEQGMFNSLLNLITTGGAVPPEQVEAMRKAQALRGQGY